MSPAASPDPATTDGPADPTSDDPTSDDPTSDDPTSDDPETITASERTRTLIHELAVGLTRIGKRLDDLKEGARKQAAEVRETQAARRAEETAREAKAATAAAAERARERAAQATAKARTTTSEAVHRTDDAVARARAVAVGLFLKAESGIDHTAERLHEMGHELGTRARTATAAGKDFFSEHREEILALLVTAAKVAAVVGVRRLAAPRDHEDGLETAEGRQQAGRRFVDAGSVLIAVVGQLGTLLARQPSSLPMLRELYAKGEPAEQAVVGMLLGPTLSSDPDHAVEVVREFLESATSEGAADTIARRSLAPLLDEHPELVDRVLPWFQAAAPFVRRAALLALARVVSDRTSRVGHILAAAVVVLEDHDEEVRQALTRLFRSSGDVDPQATAQTLADHLDAADAATRAGAEAVLAGLPEDLQERVRAARTDPEA